MLYEENNYTFPNLDEIIKLIGEGGYGKVILVRHEGRILARKEVRYNANNESAVNHAIHEIDILQNLHHGNVVEYVFLHKNKYILNQF